MRPHTLVVPKDTRGLTGVNCEKPHAPAPAAKPSKGINLPAGALQQADGSSLMTVLREQLGLKLQSAPGPVEVLVIDNVETPSPNRSIGASAFPRHVLRALVVAESDEP